MDNESLIHLRVPSAQKGRWVRASRTAGLRLTDWITQIVEAHLMNQALTTLRVPDDLDFSELKLSRDPDGAVSFDQAPIDRICAASGIDVALFAEAESNLGALIAAWYREHLSRGGARDPVQDDLIAEIAAEERLGQTVSLPPGRA